MHRSILVPLALAGALTPLASASAAQLTTSAATCARSGTQVSVQGSGFTPNGAVTLGAAKTQADATGSFVETVTVPDDGKLIPVTRKLSASDDTDPSLSATASIKYVGFFYTNFPITGRPTERVQWKFAGFDAGKPIYGHFRYRGTTAKNYRFGIAKGDCGTLSVKAKRLPAASHPGVWTLQLDQQKVYNAKTLPRRTLSFSITRTYG